MKSILKKSIASVSAAGSLVLLAAGCSENSKNMTLNGAGASFPAPVYQSWADTYSRSTPGIRVNYQSLGSGAGINQIKAGTVDFAGTDNPLTVEQLRAAKLRQFPMLTGGVVVIFNLPGVGDGALKLNRSALAGIFLGKISRWNDPILAQLNPGMKLPDLEITVVRRADASGTTAIYTDYLSKISPEWKDKVGSGASVKWPVGIGGQKNPGVCNSVAKIRGAIGYTEFTYAVEAKLAMVQLENRAGKFVSPMPANFLQSAASADWEHAPAFRLTLTDQPGENSWPITGVTYILLREDCPKPKLAAMIEYFNWCYTSGAAAARNLNYVPIPENAVGLVQKEIFQ